MNDFFHEDYRNTIKNYLENDYFVGSFNQIDNSDHDKYLILRHDIDNDIDKALEFAIIENELGVSSSYFFRVNARYYNLLNPKNIEIVKNIENLNHEIGIHLEFNIIDEYKLETLVKNLLNTLNINLAKKIETYSLHEPSRVDFEVTHKEICDIFGLMRGSYENRFFKDIKYLSDSGGRWREGHFNEWVNVENKLQVLTHPWWWFKKYPQENY